MSELDVVEGKINGWTVREMRNDHRICKCEQDLVFGLGSRMEGNHLVCLDAHVELSDP